MSRDFWPTLYFPTFGYSQISQAGKLLNWEGFLLRHPVRYLNKTWPYEGLFLKPNPFKLTHAVHFILYTGVAQKLPLLK